MLLATYSVMGIVCIYSTSCRIVRPTWPDISCVGYQQPPGELTRTYRQYCFQSSVEV